MELQLNGRRKLPYLAWREQVRCLYEKILSDESYMAAMTKLNYPQSRLQAELTTAEKAFHIHGQRQYKSGYCEHSRL